MSVGIMALAIVESLRRILRSGYVEIATTGYHDVVLATREILMHHLHGELFLAYTTAVKVLKDHLAKGGHLYLSNLAYRIRQRLGFVLGIAISAEQDTKYRNMILNLAFTNGWTFSDLRIYPTAAPHVSGNCVTVGSCKTIHVTRREFEHQKLLESGLPQDILFPENTLVMIFDKMSPFSPDSQLASKMFQVADNHSVNLVMVCSPGGISPYAKRILRFARDKHVAVSIWSDLDSGGKPGSHSLF